MALPHYSRRGVCRRAGSGPRPRAVVVPDDHRPRRPGRVTGDRHHARRGRRRARRGGPDGGALVLGGGSNLIVADEGVRSTVLRMSVRGLRRRRSRNADEGAPSSPSAPGRTGTTWLPPSSPRVTPASRPCRAFQAFAGATPIQNVGAYGNRDRRGADRTSPLSTASPSGIGGDARRPTSASAIGPRYSAGPTARSSRPSACGWVARRDRSATPSSPGPSVSRSVPPSRRRRSARRCSTSAAPREWSSIRTIPTPAAPDRSSPIRSCAIAALSAARAGHRTSTRERTSAPPTYPADDGIKLSAAWLIERAGFGKGYTLPGSRVAVSGKHSTGADQSRRGDHRRVAGAGQEDPERGAGSLRRDPRAGTGAASAVRLGP